MPDRTREARGRRSDARERRRSRVSEPFEELDQAAASAGSEATPEPDGKLSGAAAKVVGTALAAGVLGALGGAAKALLERRDPQAEPAGGEQEAGAEPPASDEDVEASHHEPEPEDPGPAEDAEPRSASDDEESRREVRGVSAGEAAEIVAEARRQLEGLLGSDVERVSGLERADGRWSVMLEVVEVARVPESTDVMATYEVVLDDEGSLVSVNRTRRYRRSQVDDER